MDWMTKELIKTINPIFNIKSAQKIKASAGQADANYERIKEEEKKKIYSSDSSAIEKSIKRHQNNY